VTILVVDSSVAIKWVASEPGTQEAVALLRFELHAPDLLIAECTNVLWKKARRGQMSAAAVDEAVTLFGRAGLVLYAALPLMRDALKLSASLDHPAYDCLYLALTESLDAAFVTADERLLNKLPPKFLARTVRLQDSGVAFPEEVFP